MYQRSHISMMMQKFPFPVEINRDNFPHDQFSRWMDTEVEKIATEKEDCMGGKWTDKRADCGHLSSMGTNDEILFFHSLQAKNDFISKFGKYVIKENPINKKGEYDV